MTKTRLEKIADYDVQIEQIKTVKNNSVNSISHRNAKTGRADFVRGTGYWRKCCPK